MYEPAQKCENFAIFKQNYTPKVFVAFKRANSCCFGLKGNLDFPDFLQKSIITSTTELTNFRHFGKKIIVLSICLRVYLVLGKN